MDARMNRLLLLAYLVLLLMGCALVGWVVASLVGLFR